MQSLFRKCLVVAVVSIFCVTVHGQKKKRSPAPAPVTKEKAASATTNPPSPSARSGPKPYKDVITSKAISSRGLFTVHKIEDRYLFEIPDTLFGRDLLIVGRISKGGADIRGNMLGYGGDQINEALVRFEKGPNNRIFLKTPSYSERAFDSSSNGMFRSLSNSSLLSIAAAFEIKAYHYTDTTEKLSDAAVIDLTDSFFQHLSPLVIYRHRALKTLPSGITHLYFPTENCTRGSRLRHSIRGRFM